MSSTSSKSHQSKRRKSSKKTTRSLNGLFKEEDEEVAVKFGTSNVRQIHQKSSSPFSFNGQRKRRNSSKSSIESLNDLIEGAQDDEEVSVEFGTSNSRQVHEHASTTSSLSDLSVSDTDSDGLDPWDLEEFCNNSGVEMRVISDDEEYCNSSGGDLRMIDEDQALDSNFAIEVSFKENKAGKNQNSRQSKSSRVNLQERMRVDEAFMAYTIAEKAALQIQSNFRKKKQMELEKQQHEEIQTDESETDEEQGSVDVEDDSKSENEEKDWYMLVLFAVIAAVQYIFTLIKCFGRSEPDVPPIDTGANALGGPPGSGGGGGGGAAPPPGLEAMAGQAAASAGSAAGSGVAAGAGAAGTTSAAAAATGAAAATATTQVVTAVAVTSAVATAASTTGIFVPPADVTEPLIISRCGLIEPQARVGKFAMVFEGYSRPLDGRESLVMEGLVRDAYNNLTIGGDLNATSTCLDPLSREMQDVKIKNQSSIPLAAGFPSLEVFFETSIVCDKCSASRPLFKNEKEYETSEIDDQQPANDDFNDDQELAKAESPNQDRHVRLLRRKQHKRGLEDQGQLVQDQLNNQLVAAFDKSGANFFHRLIQKVIFDMEELSNIGELPEGFVSVAQAYVTPTPIENGAVDDNEGALNDLQDLGDALITSVKYQKQGGKGVFEFSYVDEDSGSSVAAVVVSDPADTVLNPIPSTPFPTFSPTREQSISPTSNPTPLFSGQPTLLPSVDPTDLPSPVPTYLPSDHPTINFSGQPTFEPSSNPSAMPSEVPTSGPSAAPSISHSDGPSNTPSISPSSVPSVIPSDVPSWEPSQSPSDAPSVVPSETPSMVPSDLPSDVPSLKPSTQPSDVPSDNPSSQPSDAPSGNPSSSPSMVPSAVPTLSMVPSDSPTGTPSMLPSMVHSDVPTVSRAKSAKPTRFPSVSTSPSASPSASAKYWIVCGSTTNCGPAASVENSNNDRVGGTGPEIAVRCCADTALPGFTQRSNTCPWAESRMGGTCYHRATFNEAEAICAGVQARLCTKDELERDCTKGTGCNHNSDLVWSSTTV